MREHKILLVEDNPVNQNLVESLLSGRGYLLLKREDAEQALILIRESPPDLILMDIHLPGMSGLEATRILKSDPETKMIPILALTALAMKGDEARVREAGCNGYLSKPIRYKEFLDKIQEYLDQDKGSVHGT